MPEPRITTAAALHAGEDGLRDAERRVERLLTSILTRWRGWQFTRPDGIDVYQAQDSPVAARRLHLEGFREVRFHDHAASRFLTCTCTTREDTR